MRQRLRETSSTERRRKRGPHFRRKNEIRGGGIQLKSKKRRKGCVKRKLAGGKGSTQETSRRVRVEKRPTLWKGASSKEGRHSTANRKTNLNKLYQRKLIPICVALCSEEREKENFS